MWECSASSACPTKNEYPRRPRNICDILQRSTAAAEVGHRLCSKLARRTRTTVIMCARGSLARLQGNCAYSPSCEREIFSGRGRHLVASQTSPEASPEAGRSAPASMKQRRRRLCLRTGSPLSTFITHQRTRQHRGVASRLPSCRYHL